MIRCLSYSQGEIVDIEPNIISEKINNKNLLWVDLENPNDFEIKILSESFRFHPLTIEDCLHRKQRSKIEDYQNYYFIVMNVFKGRKLEKEFINSEIFIFVSKTYVVTVHWSKMELIDVIYKKATVTTNIFERGIDFLLYSIMDGVIDDYFPVVDEIGEKIDEIEEGIFKKDDNVVYNKIFTLKKNMLKLRKIITAQREILNTFLRHDFTLIKEENRLYFMDIYDHIMRLFDLIDTYYDLLTGTLDLYMSSISNRMNEIMKTLTIITTIMMPLTLITGIYGMNFKNMPELNTEYGYFVTLAFMGLIALWEILYFKKKKWL
ncbi:magnesium Mg(2+) and cobalt Co(2+) transport protein CorA [Thermoanaerobacter kivui]|uniref:Magnesium transport protein CorA n=1 Tax=Thermoanaerobacter kivui TaxID=2325 RepID=A0A097AT82_THEKI|nr:magnesium/cobalt transporter CorA [Thermoanaerobacter kivui]AIS53009.1 magnesium Mg(2+) and cobalt Co(2+) transport protein CorA [Thermoanaerobacter kivui]